MANDRGDITGMLGQMSAGDKQAEEQLLEAAYRELRRIATRHMKGERGSHTLQPTALIHEAYVKLAENRSIVWQSRAHFFAVAARLMRNILVDHARAQSTVKRGGHTIRVLSAEIGTIAGMPTAELLAVNAALDELAECDPRQAAVVEMRFFGGLSEAEIAGVIGVSTKTVKREWSTARAWLYHKLR